MAAPYLGDIPDNGATVHFMWATNTASGLSVTRSTDGSIEVWKDPAGENQATMAWGITDTEDIDGLTGVHGCALNTASAFYAATCNYTVVLRKATIDTHVVNAPLAHFSIENRAPVIENGASIQSTYTQVVANGASAQLNYNGIVANGASLGPILTDTSELQTDWVNGGRLDLLLDANGASIQTVHLKTTNLPADPADDSDIDAQLAANAATIQVNYLAIIANGATGEANNTAIAANGASIQLNYDGIAANGASIQENYDSLETDTMAELSALPAAAPKWKVALMALYMALRNASLRTASEYRMSNDVGTVILEKDLSDDGTTFTASKLRIP